MSSALTKYRTASLRVKEYGNLHKMVVQTIPLLEENAKDILRSQLVQIISAFDTYLHDVLCTKITDAYFGRSPMNANLNKYALTLGDCINLGQLTVQADKELELQNIVRRINAVDSYQSPKSVEYVVGLLGISNIWRRLETTMRIPAHDIKSKLSVIIRRRNQIAHESDINPVTLICYPIDDTDVNNTILFVDNLVENIDVLI